MELNMRTAKDKLIAIADCLKGISAQDMSTAERKIAAILIELNICTFDIYAALQLKKRKR